MKIAVLGTGVVGKAHAAKLAKLGHDVVMGTQNTEQTLAKTDKDYAGNPPVAEWLEAHDKVVLKTFAEAAKHGEIIVNALSGQVAVAALKKLEDVISSKVLIDITNPLDFSQGMPPSLFVSNTDSLGEQIQQALPKAKVVKAFNTMNANIQVDPKSLAGGDHHIFICGNEKEAKDQVIELMKGYGWENIIDLGDITSSRGTEMFLPLWLRLMGILGTPQFNIKIAK